MIFLSGIHGVGKTTLIKRLEQDLKITCYSSSLLIENELKNKMPIDKKVSDIKYNQLILEKAIDKLYKTGNIFILEGHLCLLDNDGKVVRIPKKTFYNLHLDMIIVIIDDIEKISKRNLGKSELLSNIEFICEFQKQEIDYAKFLGEFLQIQIMIIQNSESGYEIIKNYIKGKNKSGINNSINKT